MKKQVIKINKSIELRVEGRGFTLWAKEPDGSEHWLLDASDIQNDKRIRVSINNAGWDIELQEAEDEYNRCFKIVTN